MSIGAFILNPKDEFEKNFYIPVAAEAFFQECWEPAINDLKLEWVNVFSVGIDLEEEDLPHVMKKLSQIKEWAKMNPAYEKQVQIIQRIDLLEAELPKVFRRKGRSVFIG